MALLGKPVVADTEVRPFSDKLMEYLHAIYKDGHITFVFSTGLVVHAKTRILRSGMHLFLKIIDYTKNTSGKYITLYVNATMIRKSENKIVNGASIPLPANLALHLHIAVCWTFHGPSNSIANETVDHINQNKSDNSSKNLRWAGSQLQSYNQKKNLCCIENCLNISLGCGRKCKNHGGFHEARHALCKMSMCSTYSQGSGGYCIAHGGGKRCQYAGCTKFAQKMGFCIAHGGGTKCNYAGCGKKARKNGYCVEHGGKLKM